MSELRIVKLNRILCNEFNNILRTFFRDTLCNITITAINISPDFHDAQVFVSILGDVENEKKEIDMLRNNLGIIKKRLFSRVQLKYVPRMNLRIDHSIKRGQEVLDILDSLEIHE